MTDGIYMTESVEQAVMSAASSSLPLETGGLLLGVFRDDGPWVTRMAEVAWEGRSASRMRIPEGVTPVLVDELRRDDPRLGYLGVWHTHPGDIGMSSTDLQSLSRDGRRQERGAQLPALSVLVRRTGASWTLEASRDAGQGAYVVPVTLTGEAPGEGPDNDPVEQEGGR